MREDAVRSVAAEEFIRISSCRAYKKKILTAHIQAVRILCGASGRAAITLHRKKQGRQMARYRFNKKVRSNKRGENKKLDTRKYKLAITY